MLLPEDLKLPSEEQLKDVLAVVVAARNVYQRYELYQEAQGCEELILQIFSANGLKP